MSYSLFSSANLKKKMISVFFFSSLIISFGILFDQEKKRSTHDLRQDQLEFHEIIAYTNSSNYSSITCYCAYVLRISRYSGFLWDIFARFKTVRRKQNLASALGIQKKFGGNRAFFRDNKASIWEGKKKTKNKTPYIALYFTLIF